MMIGNDPKQVVNEFEAGRLSRRELIVRLMALGASVAGVGSVVRGDDEGAIKPTFAAKTIDHLALNVTDIERSNAWYMKHLGLTPMRGSRTTAFLRCGNGRDFVALFRSEEPGMHHYSFGIERYDQEDAARRLREAGLTPKLRGRRTYFDDPDGIEVQVSQE